MADEDAPSPPHTNGNGQEENGHVPEIELIIKVCQISNIKFTTQWIGIHCVTCLTNKSWLTQDLM